MTKLSLEPGRTACPAPAPTAMSEYLIPVLIVGLAFAATRWLVAGAPRLLVEWLKRISPRRGA